MRTRERIAFKRHLKTEIVPGEAVYLVSDDHVTTLQGRHVEALAPLLDGTRTPDRVLADLPADIPADQARRLLDRLDAAGLTTLLPDDDPEDDPEAAYWDAARLAAPRGRVRVVRVGDVPFDTTVDALRRAGLHVTDDDADFTIVVCRDYLDPGLRVVDRGTTPWLPVKPTGARAWVGPVFTPGDGPCRRCLVTRLAANRPAEAHLCASLGRPGPLARPLVGLAPVAAIACHTAALEAAKWLAGHRPTGRRAIWEFDSLDLRGNRHEVSRLPQCPECGDPGVCQERNTAPVLLRSRTKRSVDGGGHRSASPGEVLDRYRHLVGPVTGVVRDIRRDDRGHAFFNSYRSGTNTAVGPTGLAALRSTLRCENGGKGVTPLHAEVGALCEALERHSAVHRGDETVVRGSFDCLDDAVHPDSVQLYDPRQYVDRHAYNAAHSAFQHVPEPFDDREVLDWTPVWSLTARRHRLLPTGMLYYGAPSPASVTANSNGCAAGSSLEDAVLQGMLEIVERDAIALWWYNRTRMPAVDLDAAGDPFVDELRDVYAGLDREVWVLDLTADLGIPVLAAVSRRIGGPHDDVMFGFGAHLDPKVALRRALTELNQVMPAVCALREEDRPGLDVDLRNWLRDCTADNQPYLRPDPVLPVRRPGDFGYTPDDDLLTDVEAVRSTLERRGMEVLVLDQTRPDIGLPVVKVVVPGMRHHWSRLGPGRLYDVPVELGRVARPVAYEETNPVPMFL
ncbi:TOMM precursor leader peptide-binding protein [Saccharothrix violaceirubra]|uniref:Ribosomal protein S12 methylthiotransferase accessory factor n=1 Tax=Saccharothrix violaceirubra TaxID=413306 RepID=A0A7W7T699_9PSEU|nr:TOMM precursor leader peptide-binding protein [Saccharothrix violaceirubra]MBB4967349.1 ribosomal protein S12 methylthiotransferase accessory factor [Saccharothrix violaceirubra]